MTHLFKLAAFDFWLACHPKTSKASASLQADGLTTEGQTSGGHDNALTCKRNILRSDLLG